MFILHPGQGLGYSASKQIAFGLGTSGIVLLTNIPYSTGEVLRFSLNEFASLPIIESFTSGDSVTISLFDLKTGLLIPLDSNVCQEIGLSNLFKWDSMNISAQPISLKHYLYSMSNGLVQKSGSFDVAGWTELIGKVDNLHDPVSLGKDLILGDSWTPILEIETDEIDLNISIDITNQDGSILNKSTSNILGGGDDQIKLIGETGKSSIHRLFISSSESALFTNDKILIDITYRLSDNSILSNLSYIVVVSSTLAIN